MTILILFHPQRSQTLPIYYCYYYFYTILTDWLADYQTRRHRL